MKNLDTVSRSMEQKWGVDRLPRLVSEILRIKFEQQRNLLNEAIKSNDAAKIAKQSEGMRRAWVALDQVATADGHRPLSEAVWTAKHEKTGDIVTVYRDDAQIVDIAAAGGVTFTLEELVKLIPADVLVAKKELHGIKITDVRDKGGDDLNDEIPF